MVGGLIGPSVGGVLFFFRRSMKNMPSMIIPMRATPPTAPPMMAPRGVELFLSSLGSESEVDDAASRVTVEGLLVSFDVSSAFDSCSVLSAAPSPLAVRVVNFGFFWP